MSKLKYLTPTLLLVLTFSIFISNSSYGANEYDPSTTAVVITDPQNDFLSPKGVAYQTRRFISVSTFGQ